MGITGWIDPHRDLHQERATLLAMAGPPSAHYDADVRLDTHTAFARRGVGAGYAAWRPDDALGPYATVVAASRLDNRRRLHDQLMMRPHPDLDDAELLLRAYLRWGARLVEHVDGIYAIAVYDHTRDQLTLIRDPLGAKTLFYAHTPARALVFADRATALLAHPDLDPAVGVDGLNELISGQRTPGHGVLRGIHAVAPGQLITITGGNVRAQRHWRLQAEPHPDDPNATITRLAGILTDNTADLPEHDSPAVVLLSGSTASAVAAAVTARTDRPRPRVITLTHTGPAHVPVGGRARLDAAATIAGRLDLDHSTVIVGADPLIDAAAATRALLDFPGDPAADSTLFTLLRRAALRGGAVVTGTGAGLILGTTSTRRHPHDVSASGADDVAELLNADARDWLRPDHYRRERADAAAARTSYLPGDDLPRRRRRQAADAAITLVLPGLLNRLDQLATAAGIHAYTPFADWLLAQYAWNIPAPAHHRELLGQLADEVAAGIAPAGTLPPAGAQQLPAWLACQRQRLLGILADTTAPITTLLDRDRVRQLAARDPSRQPQRWHTTTSRLIELNSWLARHRIAIR